MAQRLIPAVLVGLTVALAAALSAQADDKTTTHKGIVVSVEGNKVTMSDVDGKNLHSHMIPAGAAVTCEGAVCRLQDVRKGMYVIVTMEKQGDKNVVTLIEATKAPPK